MSKTSKAYRAAAAKVDRTNLYTPLQAAKLAKETSSTKQDATVEVAIRLGVDPRKADQMVRGTVNLPHGTGKTARVAVFAVGEKADAAVAAGADVVGSDDLIERIQGGWLEFDAAIATPDQMAKVGRIARVGHQAARTQHPSDATDFGHLIRCRDRGIEFQPAALNPLDQIVTPDNIRPRAQPENRHRHRRRRQGRRGHQGRQDQLPG